MLAPIIGSLARVELVQYSYQVEYVCALRFLQKIEEDVATMLVRVFTDLQLYNVMMARETNFRWADLSGVRRNPRPWRYILRLLQPGDAVVIERIRQERPILHLVTHMLFGISPCLFTALGGRLRLVEVVRHPLYMIKQQFKYMPRWATDVRDFSICFNYEGKVMPWFARGWEKKFIQSNPMDQAIFMLEEMLCLEQRVLSGLSEAQREQVMIVPFERFVIDPSPYLGQLEEFLETEVTASTRRVLRKQNIPRKMFAEGIGLPIYKAYGWEPPETGSGEAREFQRRRQFAAEHATAEAMEVLNRLCAEYESKFLKEIAS